MIRLATLADARAIAEIHVLSWQKAYQGIIPDSFLRSLSIERREQFWCQAIEDNTPEVWVAEYASEIVGWVAFGASQDEDADETTGEIEAIYVLPSYWGKGTGRELWLVARRRLIERGFTSATLWVLVENSRAITFYHAAGFEPNPSATKEITIAGKQLGEIRYETALIT